MAEGGFPVGPRTCDGHRRPIERVEIRGQCLTNYPTLDRTTSFHPQITPIPEIVRGVRLVPRVARAQPWAEISERFQRYFPTLPRFGSDSIVPAKVVISAPALWPVRKLRSTWLRSRSPILPRS